MPNYTKMVAGTPEYLEHRQRGWDGTGCIGARYEPGSDGNIFNACMEQPTRHLVFNMHKDGEVIDAHYHWCDDCYAESAPTFSEWQNLRDDPEWKVSA